MLTNLFLTSLSFLTFRLCLLYSNVGGTFYQKLTSEEKTLFEQYGGVRRSGRRGESEDGAELLFLQPKKRMKKRKREEAEEEEVEEGEGDDEEGEDVGMDTTSKAPSRQVAKIDFEKKCFFIRKSVLSHDLEVFNKNEENVEQKWNLRISKYSINPFNRLRSKVASETAETRSTNLEMPISLPDTIVREVVLRIPFRRKTKKVIEGYGATDKRISVLSTNKIWRKG
jgi:hypothetical protein